MANFLHMRTGGIVNSNHMQKKNFAINGGFYKFKSGSFNYIWDIFLT